MAQMKVDVRFVDYMPKTLEPGVLYVSLEFKAAAHLCACGCGKKVRTPLMPTEWEFEMSSLGPSLYPSIGNWQFECRSHYWIRDGRIIWARQWSEREIQLGRLEEAARRRECFSQKDDLTQQLGFLARISGWISGLFKRRRK